MKVMAEDGLIKLKEKEKRNPSRIPNHPINKKFQ